MMTPVPKCLTEKKTHCGMRSRLMRAATIGKSAPCRSAHRGHGLQGRVTERRGGDEGDEGGNVHGQINLPQAVRRIASTATAEQRRRHLLPERADQASAEKRLTAIEINHHGPPATRMQAASNPHSHNRNLSQIGAPD